MKWASNLEDVKENSFKQSPAILSSSPVIPVPSSHETSCKMRRSFSHSEILGLVSMQQKRDYIQTQDKKHASFSYHSNNSSLNDLVTAHDGGNIAKNLFVETKSVENLSSNTLEALLQETHEKIKQMLNSSETLGTNSTLQILKATNLINGIQEDLLKLNSMLLRSTFK